MDIMFKSTRGDKNYVTASQAIVQGIANDGGLFVPETIPTIDFPLEKITEMSYQELAYEVLKLILTDYTEEELKYCINSAYDEKFDTKLIAPLVSAGNGNFLEKNGVEEKIVILTATSGDTGKAALEGFADVEGTKIIVFYPEDGVSDVQKMQMVTQKGANTCVAAIKGNFDDAQSAVKRIFTDNELKAELKKNGYVFSSANSINIGRLAPQIVYYFYAYAQMVKAGKINTGDEINFTVPTGNFGNILAGFYAKNMGLPVKQLICASNDNKVLFDFFSTGVYDINRDFIVTVSPSMDILISSNLERLLYHLSNSTVDTKSMMDSLSKDGKYSFKVEANFTGEYATVEETFKAIKDLFEETHYVMDTHTAVAYSGYLTYLAQTGDKTPNVVVSTASPYKFAKDVLRAIDGDKYADVNPFDALNELEKVSGVAIPAPIKGIGTREVLHKDVIERDAIKEYVKSKLQ